MPLLSIVTINRNNASGLEQTLRSVVDQTALDSVRMIIVDGDSSDHSSAVIARYLDALGATVVAEPDRGIYDAMNKGLARATGDYTLFLNSGDHLVDPAVVADFRAHVARNADPRCVVMGQIRAAGAARPREHKAYTFSRHLLGLSMHRHPATFVPTGLARAIGGYSEDYGFAGDYDFMLRASFAVGIEEWPRVCSVFADDGVSTRNLSQAPALMARIRRDRFQPSGWVSMVMTAYDRVFERRYRRALRRAQREAEAQHDV